MTKLFITGGCSFSMVPYLNDELSWVQYLRDNYLPNIPTKHIYKAGCGNGLISRSVIKQLTESLKEYKSEDILVSIMWSGADRQEIFSTNPQLNFYSLDSGAGYQNPQNIKNYDEHAELIGNEEDRNYYMINSGFHYSDEYCNLYYKSLYDPVGVQIISLEHILRVQFLLKTLGIRYFFMSYGPTALPNEVESKMYDVGYLYNLIDWDNYIKKDMQTWCRETGTPTLDDQGHPSGLQNAGYCENIILPHLQKKGWV